MQQPESAQEGSTQEAVSEAAEGGSEESMREDEAAPTDNEWSAEAASEAPSVVAHTGDAAQASARAEGYLEDLRRLKADFDNYRKRALREQASLVEAASQSLVTKLLSVMDNFELAISAAEQSRDFDRMLKGVEMVFGELREVLKGEGLRAIEAQGAVFDPARHEALVSVEAEGVEEGTVVDVVRTGYELGGRVLRPAMVKVAR